MKQQTPFVQFENIQKSYDGKSLIVKDLNLDIYRGEFLTLLGPSGSGKTTSLMMLAGFETATNGKITLGSKVLNQLPPHKRDIGMVFQNYALFPHMTVAENVAFPLTVRRLAKSDIEERVTNALNMIKMGDIAHRYPSQLSGGQQQRVALARALVFEPRLVLMDEPLGALDKQLREHMQLEIKQLHEKFGLTIVYVTHDQSEALTMSDRVAVFHQGEIQQIDAPKVLYEEPKTAFVAQFIGENNQIHGSIASIDGDHCEVKLADGTLLKALAINIGALGEATTVSVRPERILLGEAAKQCDNRVSGRIKEFVYLGDHIRLCLDTCGSDHFVVKIPAGQFDGNIKFGDELYIGWQRGYTRALDVMD
ncbi:MAG: ABC transporter ATP-binding protein [Aeromonadaceae bacterium]|nr:ABC transporter ATP-binding protein [Aeromonadaceae bacterium]